MLVKMPAKMLLSSNKDIRQVMDSRGLTMKEFYQAVHSDTECYWLQQGYSAGHGFEGPHHEQEFYQAVHSDRECYWLQQGYSAGHGFEGPHHDRISIRLYNRAVYPCTHKWLLTGAGAESKFVML